MFLGHWYTQFLDKFRYSSPPKDRTLSNIRHGWWSFTTLWPLLQLPFLFQVATALRLSVEWPQLRRVTRLLQMVLLVMLARSGSLVWTITTQTQVISNYPWPHRSTPMGLLMVLHLNSSRKWGSYSTNGSTFFSWWGKKVRFWHVKPCHVLFPQIFHQIWTDGFAIPAPPRQDQAPKPVWWPSGGAGACLL